MLLAAIAHSSHCFACTAAVVQSPKMIATTEQSRSIAKPDWAPLARLWACKKGGQQSKCSTVNCTQLTQHGQPPHGTHTREATSKPAKPLKGSAYNESYRQISKITEKSSRLFED